MQTVVEDIIVVENGNCYIRATVGYHRGMVNIDQRVLRYDNPIAVKETPQKEEISTPIRTPMIFIWNCLSLRSAVLAGAARGTSLGRCGSSASEGRLQITLRGDVSDNPQPGACWSMLVLGGPNRGVLLDYKRLVVDGHQEQENQQSLEQGAAK